MMASMIDLNASLVSTCSGGAKLAKSRRFADGGPRCGRLTMEMEKGYIQRNSIKAVVKDSEIRRRANICVYYAVTSMDNLSVCNIGASHQPFAK